MLVPAMGVSFYSRTRSTPCRSSLYSSVMLVEHFSFNRVYVFLRVLVIVVLQFICQISKYFLLSSLTSPTTSNLSSHFILSCSSAHPPDCVRTTPHALGLHSTTLICLATLSAHVTLGSSTTHRRTRVCPRTALPTVLCALTVLCAPCVITVSTCCRLFLPPLFASLLMRVLPAGACRCPTAHVGSASASQANPVSSLPTYCSVSRRDTTLCKVSLRARLEHTA